MRAWSASFPGAPLPAMTPDTPLSSAHPFQRYARSHLPFHPVLEAGDLIQPLPTQDMERAVARMARAGTRGSGQHLLLLGLGSGVLARELARILPPYVRLTVAELNPQRVRAMLETSPNLLDWWQDEPQRQVLVDTSPWAILLLLHAHGGLEGISPLRNPEVGARGSAIRYGLLQKLLVLAQEKSLDETKLRWGSPSVSAAAILRPDEPNLEGFLAQFPPWLEELVIVWDAATLPKHSLQAAPPLRELARPLDADFSAQRNAMLGACRGDWVLYLDCDERLSPESWAYIPLLTRLKKLQGYWFPRRTFYPDKGQAMAGMGLWPDLQLRLFCNAAGLHFVNPVHERLRGLEGAVAITPGMPILHLNQVLNTPERIEAKYALFSQAGGSRHARSPDYPHLPLEFFSELEGPPDEQRLIVLRYNPAF